MFASEEGEKVKSREDEAINDLSDTITGWLKKFDKMTQIVDKLIEIKEQWDEMNELLGKSRNLRTQVLQEEVKIFRDFCQQYESQIYCIEEDSIYYVFSEEERCDQYIKEFESLKPIFDKFNESKEKKRETIDKAMEFFKKKEEERAEREAKTLVIDITEDMYCGSMNMDVVSDYVCMLCYGIVMEPIQCTTCFTLVCKKCVNQRQLEQNNLKCFKECGSYTHKSLSGLEKAIYESLAFRCQNDDCVERIPLQRYRGHMLTGCKVQTYELVELPKGTCAQFTYGDYGDECDGEEE